ncbi:hypothetical protein [Pseudokineococcus sp. 1T1Z-3]|uniref:hypothetical protein n=1 Tax=Pseudokineococcus sp. 1T1Z-3 TaxID=3132745 RepID=UPI00309C65F4
MDVREDDLDHLKDTCLKARAAASPEVAARAMLYLAQVRGPASGDSLALARAACGYLQGAAGYEEEHRTALRTAVRVGRVSFFSDDDWAFVAHALGQLSVPHHPSDKQHWQWKLDALLVQRAVSGDPLQRIEDAVLSFTKEVLEAPRVVLSDAVVSGYARTCSIVAQAGLLGREAIVTTATTAYELDQRLQTNYLDTLTCVYRLQLIRNAIALDLPPEEIFDPTEHHIPNAGGVLWAPYAAVLRRRLGFSNTARSERAFLDTVADYAFLKPQELSEVADRIGLIGVDERVVAARTLDPAADPALVLVDELASLVQKLMVTQAQSEEVRRRARTLSMLLHDELLEPFDSLSVDDGG